MNNKQVAHLWANQSKESGSGSHFYFEGATIFSYGPHFPIARHVNRRDGLGAVLFTTDGYSSSTARHKSYVSQACHHHRVFYVADVRSDDRQAQFNDYRTRVAELVKKAAAARRVANKEALAESARKLAAEANDFAAFFTLPPACRIDASAEELGNLLHTIEEEQRKETQRQKRARAKATRDAEKRRLQREAVARKEATGWALYEDGAPGVSLHDAPPVLRVKLNADGSPSAVVETSHGAEVPVAEVARAVRFVAAVRARGIGWQRNGHVFRVGHFQLDEVTPAGNVRAGCHTFEWSEVERFAKARGWDTASVRAEEAEELQERPVTA
jgi:hypothetical protein